MRRCSTSRGHGIGGHIVHDAVYVGQVAESGVGAPVVLVTSEHETHWAAEEFVATPRSN